MAHRHQIIIIPNVIDMKALDFDGTEQLLNSSDNPLGIANEWSIQINANPGSDSNDIYLLRIQPITGFGNQIAIHLRGDQANDPISVRILRANGNSLKDYEWDSTYTVGTKVSYIVTWDGTDLLLYIDGVLTAADTLISDFSSAMTATDRRVSVGSALGGVPWVGLIHSTSVWNVVLTQAEITTLQNSDSPENIDNRFNSGDYFSSANLQHYWRHGLDAADIGKDSGKASTLIDIGDNATGITADDIVEYTSGVEDTKALDFTTGEHLRNTTEQAIGIANAWSIQANYKPSNVAFEFSVMGIGTNNTNKDMIRFDLIGNVANDPLRIILTENDTTVIKQYDWESVHTLGVKISVIATWDGTNLVVYIDGVETAATTKTTDNAGSQLATVRSVAVGGRTVGSFSFSGDIHSVSVWDSVLTQAEVTSLQNSSSPQSIDNRFDFGSYASSSNLQHYWRCGFDATDIGRDYGNASTLIDIGDNAENITADDIVTY